MASNTSSWKNISGYEARKYRAYVEASVKSETDTTVTIAITGRCEAKYMSGYGCRVRVYVNGEQVASKADVIENGSGTVGKWAEVSGTATISKGSSSKDISCKATVSGETVDVYGGVNGGTATASTSVTVKAITYSAPNAPSGLKNTRSSNTKNVLSWTKPTTTTTKPVTAILIERKVDGGSWSQIASVGGTSTSYNDTTTSANHSYQYRIRSSNSAGKSSYVTSGTTYNTPSAPTKVTAARSSETSVSLTIANAANTATALEVQRSTDAKTWSTVSTVSGLNVKSASDSPGGGTFYYRARNTRGSLASAWSPASAAVVTVTPPNAPTLTAPVSGAVVNASSEAVRFAWTHNPVDRSSQTAAELRYSVDGGASWTTVSVAGNEQHVDLANAFKVNSTVTWGARTKGAAADFGPWSGNRTFNVYQEPSVSFELPAEGFVAENMPISIGLQYDDPSGELAEATVTASSVGRVEWSANLGASLTHELASSEWTPENGEGYTLEAVVRSTTGLTASAKRDFGVSFVPPMPASATAEPDEETGFVTLSLFVTEDEGLDLEPVAYIDVFRERDGERTLVEGGLQPGAGVVDRYAPANVDYRYAIVSVASSGAASTTYVDARLDTQWFYFVWGDKVAKGRINPDGRRSIRRPNRRRAYFAGRKSPVSFDDGSVSDERTVVLLLRTKAEADEFERLMWESGRCVYKSGDGDVMRADVDYADEPEWEQPTYYGRVSLSVTRIDGGEV